MNKAKSKLAWSFIFVLLFFLSMDFWNWSDDAVPGWLGLPFWVYYFIIIQLGFASFFYWFSNRFWIDDAE